MNQEDPDAWKVVRDPGQALAVVMPGGTRMGVTCWHRKNSQGCCPGCSARMVLVNELLVKALERLNDVETLAIVSKIDEIKAAELAALKKTKKVKT